MASANSGSARALKGSPQQKEEVSDLGEKDPQFAYTLARGIDVLRAFDGENAFISNREIAIRTGIPRPTVARLTRTLAMLGILKYDAANTRYRLTPSVLCLAHPLLTQLSIRRLARPLMQQLADYAHGAVSLGMANGLDIVLIESCVDGNSYPARPDIGISRPIATTAFGRAYLAGISEPERAALLAEIRASGRYDFDRIGPELQREIAAFPKRGYCIARDTATKGIHAVGVPIRTGFDSEVMVFNCAVAAFQLKNAVLERDIAPRLVNLVRSVETSLGRR